MARQPNSEGRARLIQAIQTPGGVLVLTLLVIEALLMMLVMSGRLSSQASDVLAYGMVACIICTLAIVVWKSDVLFPRAPVDETIVSFRKIGDQVTGDDFAILRRMLGTASRQLSEFAKDLDVSDGMALPDRERKLIKIGFVQKNGETVQLTATGASYMQAVTRHSKTREDGTWRMPAEPASSDSLEIAAVEEDLTSFLRGLDLKTVTRIMILANTGQATVRTVVDELQRLRNEQTFEPIKIQVLLRAPWLADRVRAESTHRTIDYAKKLDARSDPAKTITVEHRFFAGPSPLRCLLVEYRSGAFAGFLSHYDWHHDAQRQATSTRDRASKHARIVRETTTHTLLDSYLSWFTHFWGAHKLRTIIFDFDDTLFSTTEPQTSAWFLAIKAVMDRGLLEKGDLAPSLVDAWDRQEEAKGFIRNAFFVEQSERAIFAALVPSEAKRQQIFDEVRKERHKHRWNETLAQAQLVPNISPSELARLRADYALVIVSATDEQLIGEVLEKWHLKDHFPYVLGREAPQQQWMDIEGKSQNLIRVAQMLGVPLERMVFIGDSHADYRSARQLGILFIENKYNANFYGKPSLIRDENPALAGTLTQSSARGDLTRLLERIEQRLV